MKNIFLFSILFVFSMGVQAMSSTGDYAGGQSYNLKEIVEDAKKNNTPIMIVFEASWCGYCKRLKSEIINPMRKNSNINKYFQIAVVSLDNDREELIDFNGSKTTSKYFSKEQKARFAPTTKFYLPDGTPFGEDILGLNEANEEFYLSYIEKNINIGLSKIGNNNVLNFNGL